MTRTETAHRISIITPVRSPAPGGGGEYSRLLAGALLDLPDCRSVHVFSERPPRGEDPDRPWDSRVVLSDLWAPRAGLSERNSWSFFLYLRQQIKALSLLWRVPHSSVALIHSSFHYNPGTWGLLVQLMRLLRRDVVLVSDVRDPLFPTSRIGVLRKYHGVVASSESVRRSLEHLDLEIGDIPIPHLSSGGGRQGSSVEEPGLGRYLLFPHGLVRSKGVVRFLKAAHELARRDVIDRAVIIGRERDEVDVEGECLVTVLGPVPHRRALELMAGAAAMVILSENEGLSRAALEALGVGGTIAVPESITELASLGPDARVSRSASTHDVADQVAAVIAAGVDQRILYDLERHRPDRIARATADFAWSVSARSERRDSRS